MAQFNITITEELLHGLFLSNGKDEAFSKTSNICFLPIFIALLKSASILPQITFYNKSRWCLFFIPILRGKGECSIYQSDAPVDLVSICLVNI